ncbi:serine/threonine-protein kinase [Actinomadura rudentiformis]|uniref:serine/threonine-protein kinase n=1 Tax=Actinomadura rudentiformis TaxID=359158 RepID=UPI001CEF71EE|nr:serine/threonine-protein kinase [Actinomadura rudentiformis]
MADLRANDPTRLGGYELIRRLGEGGQGAVFLGRDPATGQQVAIKLLHAELNENERARFRFLREFEVAMRVAPFCTAQVLHVDVQDGRPYIVSEYVAGPSLHQQVSAEGPLTGGSLQRVAVGTITALVAIHQAGVVHRDFKPGNVLLGSAGARVIDFGIARALDATTNTAGMVGTPVYMAPEQIRGERAGPSIDVFAWGATIAFAATGRTPFGADNLPAVIHRVLNGEPDLGDLAGPLRGIVERCLIKDPAHRPSARDVLMSLLGHDAAPAPAPAPAPEPAPQAHHHAAPPPPVPAAPYEPERHETMTGMLQAGHDLAAQRTPEPTLPHYAPQPPAPAPGPAQAHAPGAAPAAPGAFHQVPIPHQITIDPSHAAQPKKRNRTALWTVSATVLAALLTGLVLLAPQFERDAKGRQTNDQTPLPTATTSQSVEPMQSTESTRSATPTPTETGGGYLPTTEPTHTPTWKPTRTYEPRPTHTPTDEPTHEPTDDPTPTPSPTSTGGGEGTGSGY